MSIHSLLEALGILMFIQIVTLILMFIATHTRKAIRDMKTRKEY